ncbi:MAG TPA: hypothetical protein DDW73_11625 [Rhizobium sp.]|nr:hypothetical protein [Rhizobium sp.]
MKAELMKDSKTTLPVDVSATEWRDKLRYQRLYPDMRDGVGIENFPPLPNFSWIKPRRPEENFEHFFEFLKTNRPDLIWEFIWFNQYLEDNPDAKEDFRNGEYEKLIMDDHFRWATHFAISDAFSIDDSVMLTNINVELTRQVELAILPEVPPLYRKFPWVKTAKNIEDGE